LTGSSSGFLDDLFADHACRHHGVAGALLTTNQAHFEEMAARGSNTERVTLDGGHVVHVGKPSGFTKAVLLFLNAVGDLRGQA
jgi:hypothetical protein